MKSDLTFTEKLLAFAFGLAVVTLVVLALNCIPWLLWNKAIAPMFGWRSFSFWQVFALVWALGFVGRLLFGARGGKA